MTSRRRGRGIIIPAGGEPATPTYDMDEDAMGTPTATEEPTMRHMSASTWRRTRSRIVTVSPTTGVTDVDQPGSSPLVASPAGR